MPMALAVPPSIFALHLQLNLLYQFWIHTEVNIKTQVIDSVITSAAVVEKH